MTPLQLAERRIAHLEGIIADQDETIRHLRREIEIRGSDEVCLALQRFAGLTQQEARLFAMLYAAKERPVRKVLINDALPAAKDFPGERDPKIVDVWMSRVRNKLGYDCLKTIWGGSIAISPEGIEQVERCMRGEVVRPPGAPVRRGSLLTINDAREILALKDVVSVRGVTQRYGIGADAVLDIWSGRRWGGALAALPGEAGGGMISPALIAEEVKTQTYTQVARKYGVTKGVIAGRVRAHRHPWVKRERAHLSGEAESPIENAVLILMADGRLRTTPEIAARTAHDYRRVCIRVRNLERLGLLRCVDPRRGSIPAIWQEAPE